jgi:hypothetical protein
MIMQIISTQKNKGFVIMFSVLISAIILLIASGIFNVTQKEVVLSSYARESQRAFYAADSALECALYADLAGIISTPTGPGTPFSVGTPADHIFECGDTQIESTYLSGGGTELYQYPFVFRYRNQLSTDISCAYVLVEKERNGQPTPPVETRITAVGFNVCIEDVNGIPMIPDFDDPTLLERRLSTTYVR